MQACSYNHLTATSKNLQYTHVTDIAIMLALRLWGGGGGFCPHGLWTFIAFLISKLKPLNLVTFPKIYLGTIWCSPCLLSLMLPWQPLFDKQFFQNFEFLNFYIKNHYFFEENVTFLDHFHVNLLILITS